MRPTQGANAIKTCIVIDQINKAVTITKTNKNESFGSIFKSHIIKKLSYDQTK